MLWFFFVWQGALAVYFEKHKIHNSYSHTPTAVHERLRRYHETQGRVTSVIRIYLRELDTADKYWFNFPKTPYRGHFWDVGGSVLPNFCAKSMLSHILMRHTAISLITMFFLCYLYSFFTFRSHNFSDLAMLFFYFYLIRTLKSIQAVKPSMWKVLYLN